MRSALIPLVLCLLGASCSGHAQDSRETGPRPELPAPQRTLVPTVNIANAVGWQGDGAPTPAAGLSVTAFARGLDHPRWLHVLPNGDVLVAETNAPPKPAEKGIRAWFMKRVMKKAGAATPSANRITLLRDADGDGVAELSTPFLTGLASPFGMALVDGRLYIANADAIVSVAYRDGDTRASETPRLLAGLPGGPLNHHWTKSLLASQDGRHLYVGVGSNSNVGENGLEMETGRAAIQQIDVATGTQRLHATGLRNPVGLAWEPRSEALWTVVNERDELGDALVPDYLTSVRAGAFYGWPYSYFGGHVDTRVEPAQPDMVARAVVPDYALGAHVAALGLAFHDGAGWPDALRGGAFIGEHGSWNRREPAGYKVVFVRFVDGMPQGAPIDVLQGFLDARGQARGRPVGVAVDARNALLVADDVGNIVWRVAPAQP